MKLHDMQASRTAFFRRAESRRQRLQNLVDMFQHKEIDVKKFRHLTVTLKAEHRADCRESGMEVESQFR